MRGAGCWRFMLVLLSCHTAVSPVNRLKSVLQDGLLLTEMSVFTTVSPLTSEGNTDFTAGGQIRVRGVLESRLSPHAALFF